MDVFILHHVHTLDDGDEDVKLIGVYSSYESATAAIERLRHQLGFHETPEGFTISRYPLDIDHWTEGYETVNPTEEL
jgi:hypothetical protein